MNIIDLPLSKGHRFRPGTRITPTSITIHNTGNPTSTAQGERRWLDNPTNLNSGNIASWHYVVDDKEVIRAIPDDEMSYHAKTGNASSIGVEICEVPGSYENGVRFIAWLLNQRGWGVDRLTTHKRWTGKECPRLILPIWGKFLSDVSKALGKPVLLVNGKPVSIPVKLTPGRTWVQLDGEQGPVWVQVRSLANLLGADLAWDEPTLTAKMVIK